MTTSNIVSLTHVSKKYLLYHEKPTLIENLNPFQTQATYWALKDINLKVKAGETVGLIGANGSGKTTLLKIIAGITVPTMGQIKTKGKIVSLIELTAGFQPELSGYDNIFLNGLLLGLNKAQVKNKLEDIIDFAGLGNFITAPLYTYSSGMSLRLGFSVAISADPDILVLDEHLAVGDNDFFQKCLKRLHHLINQGVTLILASHDLSFINQLCDHVYCLHQGNFIDSGRPDKVIRTYLKIHP